jgi:CRISPR/Cas system-associated exonuclease Cas4 (RecB family)
MSVRYVDPEFLYNLFADMYYKQEYPHYPDNVVTTTESVQCLTKSYYQRTVPRRLLTNKIVILSFGKLVHIALQEQLIAHGYQTEVEKPYPLGTVTLMTHCDAVHADHTREIKTITTMPHEILPHHLLQANTYTVVHKKAYGIVDYIHKPSGTIQSFIHTPDIERFKYVTLRCLRLAESLRLKALPIPEPSWLCNYCEYVDICPAKKETGGKRNV